MARDISEISDNNSVENYLEKLFRLIPTEVTAAFLAINTLLGTDTSTTNIYLTIISALFLATLSPLILLKFAAVTTKIQLFTAPVTFLIWASNIAVYRFDPSWSPDKVLPVILILWTVVLIFISSKSHSNA